MPKCDLCEEVVDEVFESKVNIIYSKEKPVSELRFCEDCIDFMRGE